MEVVPPLELAEGSFVVAKAVSFLVQMVGMMFELGVERAFGAVVGGRLRGWSGGPIVK